MTDMTYIQVIPPVTPFAVGDVVEVLNRNHKPIGKQTVRHVGKKTVQTDCKRRWTLSGEWTPDGKRSFPFPSIRKGQP